MKEKNAIIMIVDIVSNTLMWKRAIEFHLNPKEIYIFHDGLKAVECYAGLSKKPTVIVLGVIIPTMGGFEVCKSIRRLEKSNKTKPAIILIVANILETDKPDRLAKEARADEFIRISSVKPTKLANIIADYIEKQS